jgi:hypothetical protein
VGGGGAGRGFGDEMIAIGVWKWEGYLKDLG